MITVVNGYVCTSSCEAASARAGKDPSAPPGAPPGVSGKADKNSPFAGQPATVLGGALKDLVTAVAAAGDPPASNQPLLDRLA
jgi:hypothetical protein